jgi:hypothetical protein
MLGFALETLRILMINIYAGETEQTAQASAAKGKPKPLTRQK